jgi:hypothetical protein
MGPCLEEGRGSYRYLANIQKQPPHSNDENVPGTRMVLSVPLCVRTYIYCKGSCHTPVESNFHTVHMSDLTSRTQIRLVDKWGRLLRLPFINGTEGFVVEVY